MVLKFRGTVGELTALLGGSIAAITGVDLGTLNKNAEVVKDVNVELDVDDEHMRLLMEADL